MTWFLTGYSNGSCTNWAIQDGVNIEKLRDELSAAQPGAFVKVDCRLDDQIQTTVLHFAPSAWGAWMLSETVRE